MKKEWFWRFVLGQVGEHRILLIFRFRRCCFPCAVMYMHNLLYCTVGFVHSHPYVHRLSLRCAILSFLRVISYRLVLLSQCVHFTLSLPTGLPPAIPGGDEASLFAGEIFKMYQKFAALKGWQWEEMSLSKSEIGGFKDAQASITGDSVFRLMKFESGVHRVQRIPVNDVRIQTR